MNTFDILVDSKELELHILPANVAKSLLFTKEITFPRLREKEGIHGLFLERWEKVAGGMNEWIMWDIGIIQAITNPEYITEILVQNPPENTPRGIFLFNSINKKAMMIKFWETLDKK